ncbi:hypothetical protein H232_4151 [Klebsiella pneumoniae UHKPC81]|nr:hypothetical protein H232_4151 [Klebsiella pneumoniae UHKPC81]
MSAFFTYPLCAAPLCFFINYLCFLIYVILSAFSHINPVFFA